MDLEISPKDSDIGVPSPDDFEKYLPWACAQLQMQSTIVIYRSMQHEYVSVAQSSAKKKKLKGKSRMEIDSEIDRENMSFQGFGMPEIDMNNNTVVIMATFDLCDNLVQIKFENNNEIPRKVLQIIALIIKFYSHLTSVSFNKGLDRETVYELNKILPISNITDLCLDNTCIPGGNYDLLLEKPNFLRQLSLARCNIDDTIVATIAEKLFFPLPASKKLCILNLGSNKITNKGLKPLAEALRANRQLTHLNLSANLITDDGAIPLLNVLMEFPLTTEELISTRARYMSFLKQKNDCIARIIAEFKTADSTKAQAKKKIIKPPVVNSAPPKKGKEGKLEKESSLRSLPDPSMKLPNAEVMTTARAEIIANSIMGDFVDPFAPDQTRSEEGVVYCLGNNSLSYITLAYNDLSYFSVKKLRDVVKYQKLMSRRPKGLVNVCIEGNCLPLACREMVEIEDTIEMGLIAQNKRLSLVKKKTMSKTVR